MSIFLSLAPGGVALYSRWAAFEKGQASSYVSRAALKSCGIPKLLRSLKVCGPGSCKKIGLFHCEGA